MRRFKWDLSERPHSADVEQVLGYRAWSSGAGLGLSESEEKSPQFEFWAFPVFRGWGDKEAPTEESEKEAT